MSQVHNPRRVLGSINHWEYQVDLGFYFYPDRGSDNDVAITVLSSLTYRIGSDTREATELVPALVSGLMILLGKTVTSVDANTNGELSLAFDDGSLLRLADTPNYESYHIRIGSDTIIV